MINYGPDAGKLATIIEIVDGKRVSLMFYLVHLKYINFIIHFYILGSC